VKILDALNGKNKGAPPVWLMRQAGRYLPEYRALRSKHSFLEMIHTPELIEEVTLMPLKRYPLDAAILFSDILVLAESAGYPLTFEEGGGPRFLKPADFKSFAVKSPPTFVYEGIKRLTKKLSVPLLGFAGAPFTVASYIIEGKSDPEFKKTKEALTHPDFPHFLDLITNETITYLKGQIDAGVQAVQLFDTWANILNDSQTQQFSIALCNKIAKSLSVPVIYFSKSSHRYIPQLHNFSAISLSEQAHLPTIRSQTQQTIQGNLDNALLLGPKQELICKTRELLQSMKGDPAYIFNLGHGLTPKTPLENVEALVNTVKES
jgi:uroporphyrinogen decarboxylase